jgi:alkylation response protein AidB-like acyl-CoA dehydrogenase
MSATVAPETALEYISRDFDKAFVRAQDLGNSDPELLAQCTSLQRQARRYADRHLRPFADEWDRRAGRDHTFVAWEAIEAALPYRFASGCIPRAFGGPGYRLPAMAVLLEELCAADAGVANVFGAHALGITPILASLNIDWCIRYLRGVTEGERAGLPVLFAAAHTEPGAGSDVEEVDHLARARVATRATEVSGGVRVSGRKVFISNGSISTYNWVSAFRDPARPDQTAVICIIPSAAPGFSVGRTERKLGQRLCPAAEIILDDVFVPAEDCLLLDNRLDRLLGDVLSLSRGPVAAIATGIARGALERTLAYLSQRRENGRWRFEAQWVQLSLAEMLAKIQASRQLYFDAVTAAEQMGILRCLSRGLQNTLALVPPGILHARWFRRLTSSRSVDALLQRRVQRLVPPAQLKHLLGIASLAKFSCSDAAVEVCMQAMEILGEDATDPQWGVEKCLRDAKLTQIYEGTNQLNRLQAFKALVRQPSQNQGEQRL